MLGAALLAECKRGHGRRTRSVAAARSPIYSMPILISRSRQIPGCFAGRFRMGRPNPASDKAPVPFVGRLLLSCLIIVSFIPAPAQATERITPLQEVLRDKDGNFVPDRLGEMFTVSGVLVSDPVNRKGFGPDGTEYASLANLQDDTGAIVLFTRDTGLLSGGL